jgi:hypothetical protein
MQLAPFGEVLRDASLPRSQKRAPLGIAERNMTSAETGYLLIADITGYTRFLTQSELDHARGILEELFSALLKELKSPFALSNVQGDAILAHARTRTVADGRHVLDVVEALYCAFAERLEHIVRNTTCACNACRNASSLDLKLFVHHGVYVEQAIAGRHELGGSEVIFIHRLMKNRITAATGVRAYAAFTEAAQTAIELPEFFAPARQHVEQLEQFGDVTLRIVDMSPIWEARKGQRAILIADGDRAFDDISVELPVPPDRAWHFLTDPDHRGDWVEDVVKFTRSGAIGGRVQVGTVDHCAHGDGSTTIFTVVDWRPLERVTYHIKLPLGAYCPFSVSVSPTTTGCRVTVRTGLAIGPDPLRQAIARFVGRRLAKGLREQQVKWLSNLLELARGDAAHTPARTAHAATPQEVLKTAIESRLSAG